MGRWRMTKSRLNIDDLDSLILLLALACGRVYPRGVEAFDEEAAAEKKASILA